MSDCGKYHPHWQHDGCTACGYEAIVASLTTEVERLKKTVRSANSFLVDTQHIFDHSGAMNATQMVRKDAYVKLRSDISAALTQEVEE